MKENARMEIVEWIPTSSRSFGEKWKDEVNSK